MSRASLVAVIVAMTLASCKNADDGSGKNSGAAGPSKDDATTSIDAEGDTAVHDSADATDTLFRDAADAAENCPSAEFPPRTDGCPCFPPWGTCSEAELGKTCDYLQTCPSSGTRVRCERVYPKEGPMEIVWVRSSFGCPRDAGSD